MVSLMDNHAVSLDAVFHALADPTRRAVLERLGRGPAAVGELHRPLRMTLPSLSQHLGVLERCGLVRSRKLGRVRTYRLAPKPLEHVEHWLVQQRTVWGARLDQLDALLPTLQNRST